MAGENKAGKRFILLDGTTAVLIANGYRWECPECGGDSYTTAACTTVTCGSCSLVCRVREVRHWSGQKALLPGTRPDRIFRPKLITSGEREDRTWVQDAAGEVCLTSSGYSWRCPECDQVNFSPQITFEDVSCIRCRSSFAVLEIRHRASAEDLGFRTYPGAVWLAKDVGGKEVNRTGQEKAVYPRIPGAEDDRSFVG
jgi:hypothetical protein